MDLQQLYKMQYELDLHIEKNHQLENNDLFNDKVLALLVELGELANETRCFKFWSLKAPSEKNIILEEFVDGLHFILSLGLECGFDKKITRLNVENGRDNSVTEQFLTIYSTIQQFQSEKTYLQYERLFIEFLTLGEMLGFTSADIFAAYNKKNEINFTRQEEGY